MIETRSAQTKPEGSAALQRCRLFVPVDGSPSSGRAVDLAVRLALRSKGEIVLIDLFDGDAGDAESSDGEGGLAAAVSMAVAENRTAQRLRRLLLPLELRISAAGVEASGRMLHGAEPASHLRAIIGDAGSNRVLVLSNPLNLESPLRELTGDLLLTPPCTIYVTGAGRPAASAWRRILSGAMRSLWQRAR